MRIITELELRDLYKKEEFTTYELPVGARLTPSAQQFLSERRIKVLGDPASERSSKQTLESSSGQKNWQPGASTGGRSDGEKPEYMTHLRGTSLVMKNHTRIKFRGKLDSFEAYLIDAVVEAKGVGYGDLAQDLNQILEYSRQIMSAEVREQALPPLSYRGLSLQEIREHSHDPAKHYGVGHILPQPSHGKVMAQLNMLRAQSRELELAAMDAFFDGAAEPERPDIIQALNRMSSLIYILMIQMAAGRYKVGC